MKLKDISISSEQIEIVQAVMNSTTRYPNAAKSDVFLIGDFEDNLGEKVELQRNSDGKYFKGTLESVKIDISPFMEEKLKNVLYLIKLKEFDEIFEIQADSIEYNREYQKKYYFEVKGIIEWRIVFFN